MVVKTPKPTPKPSVAPTPAPTLTPSPSASSGSDSAFSKILNQNQNLANPYAVPTVTTTDYLTQTSEPDIIASVNGVFQQLMGRNATADEIKRYGAELLAAEKKYPGTYTGTTSYQETGKRATVSGTQVSRGVNVSDFLSQLVQGTAEAKAYRAATTYMDAMISANNKYRGAYSG